MVKVVGDEQSGAAKKNNDVEKRGAGSEVCRQEWQSKGRSTQGNPLRHSEMECEWHAKRGYGKLPRALPRGSCRGNGYSAGAVSRVQSRAAARTIFIR